MGAGGVPAAGDPPPTNATRTCVWERLPRVGQLDPTLARGRTAPRRLARADRLRGGPPGRLGAGRTRRWWSSPSATRATSPASRRSAGSTSRPSSAAAPRSSRRSPLGLQDPADPARGAAGSLRAGRRAADLARGGAAAGARERRRARLRADRDAQRRRADHRAARRGEPSRTCARSRVGAASWSARTWRTCCQGARRWPSAPTGGSSSARHRVAEPALRALNAGPSSTSITSTRGPPRRASTASACASSIACDSASVTGCARLTHPSRRDSSSAHGGGVGRAAACRPG